MKKALLLSTILSFGVILSGCAGLLGTKQDVDQPQKATKEEPAKPKIVNVGEDAVAGQIVHRVDSVEVFDEIPEDKTLEEWEIIKEPLPAAEGFQWVHINGTVINNSGESQTIDSTSVKVLDGQGNTYSVSTDTTIYIPEDKSPIFIEIQPTQTVAWEGYFMVPKTATGLVLQGNDLTFTEETRVLINLGL